MIDNLKIMQLACDKLKQAEPLLTSIDEDTAKLREVILDLQVKMTNQIMGALSGNMGKLHEIAGDKQ